MMKQCKNCSFATGTVAELLSIYESGNAPRMLHVLTDTISDDEHMHSEDRCQVARMMHLLTALMEEKQQEQGEELANLQHAV